MIVQRLREIQNRYGYLPDAELQAFARDAGLPLARVEEVASFFLPFRREADRPADVEVNVCRDMTCHLRGAGVLLSPDWLPALAAELSESTGVSVRVNGVSCLGRCDRAPAVWVERHPMPDGEHAWVYCGRAWEKLEKTLQTIVTGREHPQPDADADYQPSTNADAGYLDPIPHPSVRGDQPQLPAAGWEINWYAKDGRAADYAAVRKFIHACQAGGGRPVCPAGLSGKELERFVGERHPLLRELQASNLLGMGGAGAPAYGKWLDVWQQVGPEKYIVANGDESEPGTFKDRELLLRLPHLVVEGVILAGLMTGATAGYVYIRHEYHEQIDAVRAEIERATRLRACGDDIFGSGYSFPVEVFESPGGYICGEQSALLEAMEDRRAQPRNRPPELGSNGLWDKPTAVNNVETLAWAPYIATRGGAAYAAGGWRVPGREGLGFKGRRLFSVSGDVKRPGVYEVPIGLPLGELLDSPKYCGGVRGGLKAVATSGPSGGLLPARLPVDPKALARLEDGLRRIRERSPADADLMAWFAETHLPAGATHLDLRAVPLDLNFFRHLASVLRLPVEPMLGAGLGVYSAGADVLEQAVVFTRFYRNESCGKCVPCRIGSQKLYQLGTSLLTRRGLGTLTPTELEATTADVLAVGKAMQQTSICGLGYVAPIPLSTALVYFRPDVQSPPDPKPRT